MTYKSRNEISKEYKWDIEKMYKDSAACEKDIKECLKLAEDFTKYQGKLKESSTTLLNALKDRDKLFMKVENVLIYAHMKKDEDGRLSSSIELDGKAQMAAAKMQQMTAFLAPELSSIPEKTIKKFIKENKDLKVYEHHLDEVLRAKEHILKKSDEELFTFFKNVVSDLNEKLPSHKQIKNIRIRREEFEKTNSLKIKRYTIQK